MIEKIASKFGNNVLLSEKLQNDEKLRDLAFEFCHTFDVKVTSYNESRDRIVNVLSNRGIALGTLSVTSSGGEAVYIYECEGLVHKDKSSARSNEISRDSSKVRNLIKAIKTNGESPTEEKMVNTYKSAIQTAIRNVGERNTPFISVENNQIIALVEKAIGYPATEQLDTEQISRLYKKYLQQLNGIDQAKQDMQRYAKGCTVVKLPYSYTRQSQKNNGIIIGDVTWDGVENFGSKDIRITKPFERFDSITDSSIAGVGTMIRTYFEGNKNMYEAECPLGMEIRDRYYKDIDIVTASSAGNFVVLIPQHAT